MLLHSLFFKTTCDVLWLGYNTACSRYRAYQSPLYVIILQCKRRNKALSFFFIEMKNYSQNILEDVYSIQIFDILFGFCYVHDGRCIEFLRSSFHAANYAHISSSRIVCYFALCPPRLCRVSYTLRSNFTAFPP